MPTASKSRRGASGPSATHSNSDPAVDELEEGTPIIQQVLDNPFLMLFFGIALPTVLYIAWGVMEIITILVTK